MNYLPIYLFLMLAFSCKQAKKPTSESIGDSNLPLDSLVYEQLQAKFDLKFAEIEKEYESASDSRELELDAMYEKAELEMVALHVAATSRRSALRRRAPRARGLISISAAEGRTRRPTRRKRGRAWDGISGRPA